MSLADKLDPAAAFCRAHPRLSIATALIIAVCATLVVTTRGDASEALKFHKVERGRFLVSVIEGGSLQAVEEVVVRNEFEGSSRIIFIIPEGSIVNEGDLLVKLDAGEADDALNQQKITCEKALADHVAAVNNVVITESNVESNVRAGELAIKFAEMDLKKFEQIDRTQQIRSADIAIITAKEKLQLAEEKLVNTIKLESKGFETKNNLDADRLAVTTQSLTLEEAESKLKMLREYDLEKLQATFTSDHEESIKELERVKKQGESLIAEAIADRNSAKNTL